MKIVNQDNGNFYFEKNISLVSCMLWKDLKKQLDLAGLNYKEENHYQKWTTVYIPQIEGDQKAWRLELHFNQARLSGLLMDFACTGNPWEEMEEWLTEQLGKERKFTWGEAKCMEHPKFGVPLIKVYYELSKN